MNGYSIFCSCNKDWSILDIDVVNPLLNLSDEKNIKESNWFVHDCCDKQTLADINEHIQIKQTLLVIYGNNKRILTDALDSDVDDIVVEDALIKNTKEVMDKLYLHNKLKAQYMHEAFELSKLKVALKCLDVSEEDHDLSLYNKVINELCNNELIVPLKLLNKKLHFFKRQTEMDFNHFQIKEFIYEIKNHISPSYIEAQMHSVKQLDEIEGQNNYSVGKIGNVN